VSETVKAIKRLIAALRDLAQTPTCCERHGFNCQQGRDCPARRGMAHVDMPVTVVALAVVAIVVWSITNTHWKIMLVERGIAEYCENIAWAWKGECK
jgi:hypothetical protein